MKKIVHASIFSLLIFNLFIFSSYAQKTTLSLVNEESKMTIDGTSTLHDWTSEVKEITGMMSLAQVNIQDGSEIETVNFKANVKSIESGRGSTMDNRTHDALKGEEHPQIIFDLSEAKVNKSSGNNFTLDVKGELTIAGSTQPIEMVVNGEKVSDQKLHFEGSKALNMTEYGIDPPSAMFGQIQTGEEITVNFDLVFSN